MNKEQLIDLLLKLYPQDVLDEPLNYEYTIDKRGWVWNVFSRQFNSMFKEIVNLSTVNNDIKNLEHLIKVFEKAQVHLEDTHQYRIKSSLDSSQDLQHKIDDTRDIIKAIKDFAHRSLKSDNQLYYVVNADAHNISNYHTLTPAFVKKVISCATFQWKHHSVKTSDGNTLEFEPLYVVRKYMK